MRVPDPWQVLSLTDLLLATVSMPEAGRYYHRQRVVMLRTGLLLVEQRAVLWHELVHARRGDAGCGMDWYTSKEEVSVDREAARWAIPLGALAEALRGDPFPAESADRLMTTEALLRIRLDALHPAERGHLRRCAAAREDAA